jgi:hypothetical protein
VGTTFKLHPVVERGLLLGLKFVPYPKHQHKTPSTLITAYTREPKSHLEDIAQTSGHYAFRWKNERLYTTREQYMIRQMLHHPNWLELHKCHDIMKSDKNMGTTIVAHSWSEQHYHRYLLDETFYSTFKTFQTQVELDNFNKVINTRIFNQLHNINSSYKMLAPDPNAYFSNFYVVPKVHKTPTGTRSITGAFNSGTSWISRAVLDVLTDAFAKLKSQLKTDGLDNRLAICICTEDAIIKLVSAYNLATRISLMDTVSSAGSSRDLMQFRYTGKIAFSSYDFDNMYNNLDVEWSINAICSLFQQFCPFPPDFKFSVLVTTKTESTYNTNIWRQLHNLPTEDSLNILWKDVFTLLAVILIEFLFMVCNFLPLVLFKQIRGIAMGTNCAPWVANLSLAFYELSCDTYLHLIFPMARFLDDVGVAHPPNINPLPILKQIYLPSGLKLNLSPPKYNNTIYLDLQLPSPQRLNRHLKFGVFCKPGTNYEYSHFHSFIPRSIHIGLVIGGFHCLFNRHSHLDQFKWAFNNYIGILFQLGYPKAWVLKTLQLSLNKVQPGEDSSCDVDYHLILNYQPKIHLPTSSKLWNLTLLMELLEFINIPTFLVGVQKRNSNWKMDQQQNWIN